MATPGFRTIRPSQRLQQRDGLLRSQPERVYGPRPDARPRSRSWHCAGQGAGRHGDVAQGGQPDGCAAEAAVARFQANRFGQEHGSSTVGVLSGFRPLGRPALRVGVLCPEDHVSLELGGVKDEHGVVRCCVGASVDDGARLWQGARRFQEQVGLIGRISNGGGWSAPWYYRAHRPKHISIRG